MDAVLDLQMLGTAIAYDGPAVALADDLSLWLFKGYIHGGKPPTHLPSVPEVPGVLILENLLQLKEKKRLLLNGQKV